MPYVEIHKAVVHLPYFELHSISVRSFMFVRSFYRPAFHVCTAYLNEAGEVVSA